MPVNTVKEFVNQADVRNTKSETDKIYQEGLELYWGGYYKHALEKFEAFQRIYPNHSENKQYISNSEKKMVSSKTLWSDYSTIFYIVDGISGLLILVLLVFTFAFRPKNPTVAAAAPTPAAPGVGSASTPPAAPGPRHPARTPKTPEKVEKRRRTVTLQSANGSNGACHRFSYWYLGCRFYTAFLYL